MSIYANTSHSARAGRVSGGGEAGWTRTKQTENQTANYVPFISLSSVIEKYSQISYLQRNEPNSSSIFKVCRGCLDSAGVYKIKAGGLRKERLSRHIRHSQELQTIWLLLRFQHQHAGTLQVNPTKRLNFPTAEELERNWTDFSSTAGGRANRPSHYPFLR